MTFNALRLVMFARLEQWKCWPCLGMGQPVCNSENTMSLPLAIGKRSALPSAQVAAVVDRNIRSLGKGGAGIYLMNAHSFLATY